MRDFQNPRIGIVGSGAMGQGIAQIAAVAGLKVRLMDMDPAASSRAIAAIDSMLKKLPTKGKLTPAQAKEALGRISAEDSVGALADCDLVIEAIVEKLEAKRSLFAQLEEESVFYSSTF